LIWSSVGNSSYEGANQDPNNPDNKKTATEENWPAAASFSLLMAWFTEAKSTRQSNQNGGTGECYQNSKAGSLKSI